MSRIELTTPALIYPTVSLLMLAYTNRFLALASLVRELHARYQTEPSELILHQIDNLRRRLKYIRAMQASGVFSLFLCTACLVLLLLDYSTAAEIAFGGGLACLLLSLFLSMREIQMSLDALNLHLNDLDESARRHRGEQSGGPARD